MTAPATTLVGGRVRPSEAQIAAALAILPIPASGTSLGGAWRFANPAFCALVGYSFAELEALHREDLVHPEDRQRARAYERRLLDNAIASYHVAQRLVTKSGGVVWVWVTSGMLRDAQNVPVTILSSFTPMSADEIAPMVAPAERPPTPAPAAVPSTPATSAGACVTARPGSGEAPTPPAEPAASPAPAPAPVPAPAPEPETPPLAPYAAPAEAAPAKTGPAKTAPAEAAPPEAAPAEVAPAETASATRDAEPFPEPHSADAILPDVPPAEPAPSPPPVPRPTPPYSAPAVPPSIIPPSVVPPSAPPPATAAEEAGPAATPQSDPARTRLLALLGHELRTPLNAIRGYAELLLQGARGPITEAQRGDLQRITQAERHLVRLANDVLALTSIESGRLTYRHGRVRVGRAFEEALALVTPQARAKGVRLHIEPVPPELTLRADGDKVRQVLVNLLSNAVKYTPTGGLVAVSAQREGATVALLVRDTGRGIPSDMRERVFEPFVRLPDIGSAEPAPQGVGLGLAISRGLARGMGGELTVESALGAGSTFRFVVPGEE